MQRDAATASMDTTVGAAKRKAETQAAGEGTPRGGADAMVDDDEDPLGGEDDPRGPQAQEVVDVDNPNTWEGHNYNLESGSKHGA